MPFHYVQDGLDCFLVFKKKISFSFIITGTALAGLTHKKKSKSKMIKKKLINIKSIRKPKAM